MQCSWRFDYWSLIEWKFQVFHTFEYPDIWCNFSNVVWPLSWNESLYKRILFTYDWFSLAELATIFWLWKIALVSGSYFRHMIMCYQLPLCLFLPSCTDDLCRVGVSLSSKAWLTVVRVSCRYPITIWAGISFNIDGWRVGCNVIICYTYR